MANKYKAELEWRDIESITPYVNNIKKHPTEQIDKIAGAIAEFGFDQPIVVDGDGVIIKGHGRREAALRLGLKKVPVIVRTDLTPAQVKAARIADNKVAESDWDIDALKLEFDALQDLDYDQDLTGFDVNSFFEENSGEDSDEDKKTAEEIEGDIKLSDEIDIDKEFLLLVFDKQETFDQVNQFLNNEKKVGYWLTKNKGHQSLFGKGPNRVFSGELFSKIIEQKFQKGSENND